MSELLRETMHGYVGKRIRDDLLALIDRLDKQTLQTLRDGTKSLEQSRYAAGVSDGVRLALNLIMELGQHD